MRFSRSTIDDLKRQADIVRIISDYVPLKKKGANWMACCPFHQEKSPSFSVSPAKEIFYCFGCHKGGTVINFVMDIEGVSFPEAIKIIAEKSGLQLPMMQDNQSFAQSRSQAEDTIELNTWAMQWWESQLKSGDRLARPVIEYLENRGVTSETWLSFHLGYAPESWDALSNYLRQRGASNAQIEQSGLVVRKETGGFYDRFRGRLIFPVMDANGRVIAFGGRTMSTDGEPKYLNSPETAAYHKGDHLYGLNLSRDQIRRQKYVILVEGYFDLIMLYQFGVRNSVASLGTALTLDQVRLLGRYARQMIVNYDGDKAGLNAAYRALEPLLQEEFEVKLLLLPDGADPDEFVRTSGVEAYRDLHQKAASALQFTLNRAVEGRNLHRPEEKTAAVTEVISFLRMIKNRLLRRESFDLVMNDLKIDDPGVRRDLWQAAQPDVRGIRENSDQNNIVVQKAMVAARATATIAELRLLELLINRADVRRASTQLLTEDDFNPLPTASIFRAVNKLESDGVKDFVYEDLKELLVNDQMALELLPRLLITSSESDAKGPDELQEEARRCSIALKLMNYDRRLNEFGAEIAAAERVGDRQLCDRLAGERVELMRQRNSLLAGGNNWFAPAQSLVSGGAA